MSGLPSPLTLVHASLKAVDGGLQNLSYAAEAVNRSFAPLPPITSDFIETQPESIVSQSIEAVRSQVKRGLPVTAPPLDLVESLFDAFESKKGLQQGIDDRKMALEYALVLLSRLPPGGKTAELEHAAIRLLYRDLPHPPSTHMGTEYAWRTADGSRNSSLDPDMGKSFTPYSRSCTSTHPLPPQELPDVGLVFDALSRRDKFVPHPAGLSGLFFNYATTVIHSVFRTSRTNWNINETSSYVDLGILYGNTQDHQDTVRDKSGYGRIHPDVFAETRLLSLPPGVCAIIILFNRNHNYIADMLLKINEKGEWSSDVSKLDDKAKAKQDEAIFQTARLINAATYANVVLGDYLAAILGTVRDGSSWTLNIGGERREADHTLLERGAGNSCSVEFNVLYRLHPSMSQDDEQYTEKAFEHLFGTRDFDKLTVQDFENKIGLLSALRKDAQLPQFKERYENPIDDSVPLDLRKVNIPGFKRDAKGNYDDAQLAAAMQKATSVPAGAFKARGVPGVMRVIEMLGMEQARNWGCCTLNEFRRFLGLKAYATFEEWNPDPEIAETARKLYRHPENLELYVGLVAEESKPVMDGAGLCPSYTMSRAILADAIALVRGDRHLTYDMTPFNLTNWGFTEASRNTDNAAWGGVIGRLMTRCLPNHYNDTSVYTHFPLMTPQAMEAVLTKIGTIKEYSLDPPTAQTPIKPIAGPNEIQSVLGVSVATPPTTLKTVYLEKIKAIGLDPSFLSSIDEPPTYAKLTSLVQSIFVPETELDQTGAYFYDKTLELIREKSFTLVDKTKHSVDLVKDVLRLIPVHWSSTQVAGLPLKTSFEPRGIYYEQQMYQMLKEIYAFIYLPTESSLTIPLRMEARENVERLNRFIKLNLRENQGGLPASLLGTVASLFIGDGRVHVNSIAKRLLALGAPIDELANDVLGVISTASIELTQIFTHVINFYLNDEQLKGKIIALAKSGGPEAIAQLEGYVREALRLDPVWPGVYRKATAPGKLGPVEYQAGDRLFFSTGQMTKDKRAFPNPTQVDPTRDSTLYSVLHGDGVFKVLGEPFVYRVTAQVVRAVFELSNVRRGVGSTGTLRRFQNPVHASAEGAQGPPVTATPAWNYLDPENANRITPFATGLILAYDN